MSSRKISTQFFFCLLIFHLSVMLVGTGGEPSGEPLTIRVSRGLLVSMIPKEDWNFVHAQLIIPIQDRDQNPIIPRLTSENLFDKSLLDSNTNLLDGLRKLGGDYRVDYHPNEIRLIVNFPAAQMHDFALVIKEIFSFTTFSLKRFDNSRFTFFDRFTSQTQWPQELALALAYQRFFPGHPSGRGPIQAQNLEKLNLSYLRSFYGRIFRPERCVLIMSGSLNPHTTYGLMEMTLSDFKKPDSLLLQPDTPFPVPAESNMLICVETERCMQLSAFIFAATPPVHDLEHYQERIIHNIFFAVPQGRLFTLSGIRPMEFRTQFYHHPNLSVVSTEIVHTQFLAKNLELLQLERRRMVQRPFEEREYLIASNILLGQLKVGTNRYDYEADLSLHSIDATKSTSFLEDPEQLLKVINYPKTIQYMNKKPARLTDMAQLSAELIIVIGTKSMLNQFKSTLSPALLRQTETQQLRMD